MVNGQTADANQVMSNFNTIMNCANVNLLAASNNLSDVTNAATSRSNLGLGAAALLADPIVVAHGGTGLTTLTAHGLLLGEGTSNVGVTAAGTNGQLPIGQTGADPTWNTVTGDWTITVGGVATIANAAVTGTKTASNTIANSNLANMAANSIKCNNTGAPAAPLDCTVSQVQTLLSVTPPFVSSGNAFASNSFISVAHGLGARPTKMWANIRCTSNDAATGYVTGDIATDITLNGTNTFSVWANSTNVGATMGGTLVLANKSGAGASAVTSTNNFVIDLYAQL